MSNLSSPYARAANRATRPTLADYSEWCAQEYFDTYYRETVLADERHVLAFELDALADERSAFGRALEYGCGPTLHRAIAAARHAFRIDMADRSPDNLRQIQRWLQAGARNTDWNRFTRFILEHERGSIGHECASGATERALVEAGAIERREALTRKVIRELRLSDARSPDPLGAARAGFYDLLISGFCLDAISGDKRIWHACMGNVIGTLRSGGLLLMLALHRCRAYRVGDRLFPCADLTADDLFVSLVANGLKRSSVEIDLVGCPDHAVYGYTGILIARAHKA